MKRWLHMHRAGQRFTLGMKLLGNNIFWVSLWGQYEGTSAQQTPIAWNWARSARTGAPCFLLKAVRERWTRACLQRPPQCHPCLFVFTHIWWCSYDADNGISLRYTKCLSLHTFVSLCWQHQTQSYKTLRAVLKFTEIVNPHSLGPHCSDPTMMSNTELLPPISVFCNQLFFIFLLPVTCSLIPILSNCSFSLKHGCRYCCFVFPSLCTWLIWLNVETANHVHVAVNDRISSYFTAE